MNYYPKIISNISIWDPRDFFFEVPTTFESQKDIFLEKFFFIDFSNYFRL